MSLQSLVADAYAAFQYYSQGAQVVLLHPDSRLRSMLVAHLLNETPKPIFYYAIGADDVSIESFIDGITHDLANQHPTFGRHLYQTNWREYEQLDLEAAVDAFVADINEISSEPFMLILDEFDASDTADLIQVFWERVVRKLPFQCQLVINSRTLPRMPWVSLMARQQAVMLKDSEVIRELFYRPPMPEAPVQIDAIGLGPGSVTINGTTIEDWEGHLPRLLLFFVLERPLATRDEICRTFWPDLDSEQAVNVFHVTKRRLHKALNYDVLVHQDGYYQVNPEAAVTYDVEAFTAQLMKGRLAETPEESFQYWQIAASAYSGPFLQGHTEYWIQERRDDFLLGYLEAMSALAHLRLAEGRDELALNLLLKAVGEDPRQERIHREIMQLYTKLGRRGEAAGHYKQLLQMLAEAGRNPEPATQEIYNEIAG